MARAELIDSFRWCLFRVAMGMLHRVDSRHAIPEAHARSNHQGGFTLRAVLRQSVHKQRPQSHQTEAYAVPGIRPLAH